MAVEPTVHKPSRAIPRTMRWPPPAAMRREDDVVHAALAEAMLEEQEISDLAARIIASWWYQGRHSALHRFVVSGAIDRARVLDEYLARYEPLVLLDFDRLALDALGSYLVRAAGLDAWGDRGRVFDWDTRTHSDRQPWVYWTTTSTPSAA